MEYKFCLQVFHNLVLNPDHLRCITRLNNTKETFDFVDCVSPNISQCKDNQFDLLFAEPIL